MRIEDFITIIDSDFYTGVPDSQLQPLCNYLYQKYGVNSKHHMVAANEGNCVGLAAGYYLSTGKIPVVYMQNSGIGNALNPIVSLLNEKVYAIPSVFVVGWRGEPGIKDEPQHVFQGEITIKLLEDIGLTPFVITKETSCEDVQEFYESSKELFLQGKSIVFVVKKGALAYETKVKYVNSYSVTREEIIEHIVEVTGEDPIVTTTGKASRELFEIREKNQENHDKDFLTVGSMGHSSSIALSIALQKPSKKVWCIDGDGAVLMHMGSMATLGSISPANMIHILINNEAHETVGGMPTVANKIDFKAIAIACGYEYAVSVDTLEELDAELAKAKKAEQLVFIEVKASLGSRKDLGRPTTTTHENRDALIRFLEE